MTRVRLLLVVLSIGFGAVMLAPGDPVESAVAAPVPEAAPSFVSVNHEDCGQSWHYSQRVCYDTGSKWFHIYTTRPWQAPNLSFPSNSGASGIGSYVGQVGILNISSGCGDEHVWNGGNFIHLYRWWGGCSKAFLGNIIYGPFYDGDNRIAIWGGNWDFLVWYLAIPGYDLVITGK